MTNFLNTQDEVIGMDGYEPDRARAAFVKSIDLFEECCPGLRDIGAMIISSIALRGINSCLVEGLPGGGKTRSMEIAAALIGGLLNIVQGNPDLTPNMVLGSEFQKADGEWTLKWGKFVRSVLNFLDEINRCNPRFQSVWMGAMSERRVTMQAPHVEDESLTTVKLPRVSMFMAAQNDEGSEGTYPIPPASKDRFLHAKRLRRIPRWAEVELVNDPKKGNREIIEYAAKNRVLDLKMIAQTGLWVTSNIKHTKQFSDYLVTVVRMTHPETEEFRDLWRNNPEIRPILEMVESGLSVRSELAFLDALKMRAFLFGKDKDGKSPRNFLMPEDVRAVLHSVGDHRVMMNDLAEIHNKGKGPHQVERFGEDYPADGTITREQIVHRLNAKGRNPILPSHMIDVALAYSNFTDDPSKFRA